MLTTFLNSAWSMEIFKVFANISNLNYFTKIGKYKQYKQAGLTWGSVQAEKVRLQRQSYPGLIDIYCQNPNLTST